jgi:hypothetical protein
MSRRATNTTEPYRGGTGNVPRDRGSITVEAHPFDTASSRSSRRMNATVGEPWHAARPARISPPNRWSGSQPETEAHDALSSRRAPAGEVRQPETGQHYGDVPSSGSWPRSIPCRERLSARSTFRTTTARAPSSADLRRSWASTGGARVSADARQLREPLGTNAPRGVAQDQHLAWNHRNRWTPPGIGGSRLRPAGGLPSSASGRSAAW